MNKLKSATMDLTKEISVWILWYLPVFAVIIVPLALFLNEPEITDSSFMEMIMTANRVFMFVAGILSAFFYFEWLFKMGITRKMYFKVITLTMLFIVLILNVTSLAITYIFDVIPYDIFTGGMPSVSTVVSAVLVSYLGAMLGCVIGMGFYKSAKAGFLMIAAALIIVGCEILIETFNMEGGIVHFSGFIIITALLIMLNYKLTRRIPVKL